MLSAGAHWRAGLDTTVRSGRCHLPCHSHLTMSVSNPDHTAWRSNLCPDCNQNKVRTKATGLGLSCETKRKTSCCLSVHGCTEKGLRPLPTPLQPSLESFNRDLASKTRGPLGVCLYLFPSTHPPHQPRSRSPGQNCAFVMRRALVRDFPPQPATPNPALPHNTTPKRVARSAQASKDLETVDGDAAEVGIILPEFTIDQEKLICIKFVNAMVGGHDNLGAPPRDHSHGFTINRDGVSWPFPQRN